MQQVEIRAKGSTDEHRGRDWVICSALKRYHSHRKEQINGYYSGS